jgi:hypothetical protein
MDGITLLREAEAAGLSVEVVGDKLVVRGPKRAEAVALRLLAHKPDVIKALRAPAGDHGEHPVCRWPYQGRVPHRRFWLSVFGTVRCASCSPPAYPGLVLRWIEPTEN